MLDQSQIIDLDKVRNIPIVPRPSRSADLIPPVDWRVECRTNYAPTIVTKVPTGEFVLRQGGNFITIPPDELPRLIARLYRLARGAGN